MIVDTLKKIRLLWSSRPLVMATLRYGGNEDLQLVLDKVAEAEHNINYWNHTELGVIVEQRMSASSQGIPDFLTSIMRKAEFWGGIHGPERKKANATDFLPIKNSVNRPLYVRLAAYAAIGSSDKKDEELLIRLAMHKYGLIARSAASRLIKLFGAAVFSALTALITDRITSNKTGSISEALIQAELKYYRLLPEIAVR